MSETLELIARIQERAEELATRTGRRKPVLHGKPANEALSSRLAAMPVSPPAAYTEFLGEHNGWENFWQNYSLIGAEGAHTDTALEDVAVTVDEDVWAQQKYFPDEAGDKYVGREDSDPDFIHLPNHPIVGTNFNGGLAIFDRRLGASDGQAGMLLWTPAGVTDRYPSFVGFLEAVLASIERDLAAANG